MSTTRISRCRSCDASIVWMITNTGSRMPVDADSVDESELEWFNGSPVFDPQEHESDFATCPNANQHRRRTDR